MTSMLTSSDPVRHPEGQPAPVVTKRAWVLWLLTIFVPGGAQVVAGNKKLGRFALGVTMLIWAAIVVALVMFLVNREWLIHLAADTTNQMILAGVLIALAVWWLILFLNTLALTRPGLLAPGMRVIVTFVIVATMAVTTASLGYGSYLLLKSREAITTIFAQGPPVKEAEGRYNILVMGGDAGKGRVGLRPDSTQVWSIDARTGRAVVISIPRNLQNVPFPKSSPMSKVYPDGFSCGNECIFNAIYPTAERDHKDLYPGNANPGAQATMEAASAITGLDVQSYVVVDMGGFRELINALGGVTITSGGWVPYHGKADPQTGLKTKWFEPGQHHFTGNQALWFARSRYFTDDYHRIRRQQCLQQAMVNQFQPANVLTNFTAIVDSGKQVVHTDIPQSQLGSFISLADKTRQHPFKRLTLGAPDFGTAAEKFSTHPDYKQIHARIKKLVGEATEQGAKASDKAKQEAKATQAAKPSGSKGAEKSTAPEPTATSNAEEGGSDLKVTDDVPTTQPDGSPITEEYLQKLELAGATSKLTLIAQNNDDCKAG